MDKSETYIKMCEKAEEIQESWKPKEGDWCIDMGDLWILMPNAEHKICTVTPAYVEMVKENDTWLPSQDDLQKMVIGKGILSGDWLDVLEHFVMDEGGLFDFFDAHRVDETYNYVKSMEQLWLSFVMKKRYNKVWSNNEWRNGSV